MKCSILTLSFLALTFGLTPFTNVAARPERRPAHVSANAVIDEVNAYRLSRGLPPYSVNSILMGTAEGQAGYMAATGNVEHTGPGGISVTERLLSAGYPLAGDLSRGGWRSENILALSSSASAADVVYSGGWADALHQETMLSPNLSEIGAGVAVNGGLAYVVIDCAQPTGNGQQPDFTPSVGGTPGKSLANEYIVPITLSTPRADGAVIHTVQSGQSLWAIAIAYGVKIEEIRTLNKLGSNDIFPNQDLIVKYVATSTIRPPSPTSTHTIMPDTATPTSTSTTDPMTPTPTINLDNSSEGVSNGALAVIIICVALAAGGIGIWFGMKKS